MRKKLPFYIFILMIISLLSACGSARTLLRKADNSFERGEYAVASDLYKKAYRRISYKDKPLRSEAAFKQAESYRLINNSRAEQMYQNAVRNLYPDTIVFLRLAQMQQKNGKYKEAEKSYETYLEVFPEDELGINGLRGVRLLDSLKNNPSRYIVKREKDFNAVRSSSFSPSFASSDGDVLVFTSNRKYDKKEKKQKRNNASGQPNNHLFTVKKNSQGEWEKPEIIEGEVNSNNDEGVSSFPTNGSSMYFTRSITEDNKGEGTMIV
ncbi:MAG: hypothetical protein GX102_02095, partial [Porphyromonadaceae bacterium]|nr:hypothetical protein [Porphyromonadaceae bacterium]